MDVSSTFDLTAILDDLGLTSCLVVFVWRLSQKITFVDNVHGSCASVLSVIQHKSSAVLLLLLLNEEIKVA